MIILLHTHWTEDMGDEWRVYMEFVTAIPSLLTAIGGFVVALAVAALINKLGSFIEKLQV